MLHVLYLSQLNICGGGSKTTSRKVQRVDVTKKKSAVFSVDMDRLQFLTGGCKRSTLMVNGCTFLCQPPVALFFRATLK